MNTFVGRGLLTMKLICSNMKLAIKQAATFVHIIIALIFLDA